MLFMGLLRGGAVCCMLHAACCMLYMDTCKTDFYSWNWNWHIYIYWPPEEARIPLQTDPNQAEPHKDSEPPLAHRPYVACVTHGTVVLISEIKKEKSKLHFSLELEALQNSDFESRVHRRGFLLRLAVAIHHTPPPLDTTTTTLPHFSRVISGYTTHRPSSSSPPWVVIVVVGGCGVVGCGVAGSMSGRSGGSCGGGWDAAMLLFCCWFSTSAFAPTAPAAAAAPSNPAGLPPGPLPPGREFAMCAAP